MELKPINSDKLTQILQPIQPELTAELLNIPPNISTTIDAEIFISKEGAYYYRRHIRHKDGRIETKFKAISPSTLRLAFSQEPLDSDWLPPEIIRHGSNINGEWAIAFFPPQLYTINCNDPETKNPTNITIPLPSIILIGLKLTYHLAAIKEPTFHPHALCYHVPLPNIDPYSLIICWGKNTPPPASPTNLIKAWNLFISSPFNHDLAHNKSISPKYKNNICKQLFTLHNRKNKRNLKYPLKTLVPLHSEQHGHLTIESLTELLLTPPTYSS